MHSFGFTICQLSDTGAGVATALFAFGAIVLVSIGIFLLIRSIMLWYWKVSTIVENQEKQIKEQQKLATMIQQFLSQVRQKQNDPDHPTLNV